MDVVTALPAGDPHARALAHLVIATLGLAPEAVDAAFDLLRRGWTAGVTQRKM